MFAIYKYNNIAIRYAVKWIADSCDINYLFALVSTTLKENKILIIFVLIIVYSLLHNILIEKI